MVVGNYFTRRRYLIMKRFLEFVGIDPNDSRPNGSPASEGQKFAQVVTDLTEEIRALGPNRKLRDQHE
jgi:coenzyme F420-reducing hydrogenase delta subunit